MSDLVVLVPSRGRPKNVAELMDACQKTCRADTRLHFGFDIDDPQVRANLDAADWPDAIATTGPRDTLTGWTNKLAFRHLEDGALASIGDDMRPETIGWDEILLGEIAEHGPGFACPETGRLPEHGRRPGVPEAWVVDTRIVRELGWVCNPAMTHWYVDDTVLDIATRAGCHYYRPDVMIRHYHPNVTGAPGDATYEDAAQRYDSDRAAYQRWRIARGGLTGCVDAVRRVREEAAGQLRHRGPHDDLVHVGEGVAAGREDS